MLLLLAGSITSVSWSTFFFIASLILLGLAVFAGNPSAEGPFYRRLDLFRMGVLFFVLAVALSGK